MDIDVDLQVTFHGSQLAVDTAVRNVSGQPLQLLYAESFLPDGNTHPLSGRTEEGPRLSDRVRQHLEGGAQLFFRVRCLYRHEEGRAHTFIKDWAAVLDPKQRAVVLSELASAEAESLGLDALADGDLDAAIAHLSQALASAECSKSPIALMNILGHLGTAYLSRHDYREAAFYSRSALDVEDPVFERPRRIVWQLDLASAELGSGQLAAAETAFEDARSLAKATGDEHSLGIALAGIANCRRAEGRMDEAASLFAEAISMARASGDARGLSRRLGNLGLGFCQLEDRAGAAAPLQEAIEIAVRISDLTYVGKWVDALLECGSALGDFGPFTSSVRRVLASDVARQSAATELEYTWRLAAGLAAAGRLDEAVETHERAAGQSRALGDARSEMTLLLNLANLEVARQDPRRAWERYMIAFWRAADMGNYEFAMQCAQAMERLPASVREADATSAVELRLRELCVDRWLR